MTDCETIYPTRIFHSSSPDGVDRLHVRGKDMAYTTFPIPPQLADRVRGFSWEYDGPTIPEAPLAWLVTGKAGERVIFTQKQQADFFATLGFTVIPLVRKKEGA